MIYPTFAKAIKAAGDDLRALAHDVPSTMWQSTNVADKPEMRTHEILNWSFQAPVTENLDQLRSDIEPNLPWADDHFQERIGGYPLNPGEQWKNWPWSHSADKFRKNGQFSHTYMERYWPKYAQPSPNKGCANVGIRFPYGDVYDLVYHLQRDPLSRQAYLPVWFPEDTGVVHGERVPCTLGYHFIQRHGFLHTVYYIRSCDYLRHFRDDIYLTARLTLWMLDSLRTRDPSWRQVVPGLLTMHITSLHLFRNDYIHLFGKR